MSSVEWLTIVSGVAANHQPQMRIENRNSLADVRRRGFWCPRAIEMRLDFGKFWSSGLRKGCQQTDVLVRSCETSKVALR